MAVINIKKIGGDILTKNILIFSLGLFLVALIGVGNKVYAQGMGGRVGMMGMGNMRRQHHGVNWEENL